MTDIESWKQEPVSPDWFEIDDWVDYGDTTILDDIDFIIKEEPQFPAWPEGTTTTTSYESNYGLGNGGTNSSSCSPPVIWVEEPKTSQLLQEFEDVLTRALTPPDSPQQQGISPTHQTQPFYHPTLVHLQPPQPVHPPLQQQELSNQSSVSEIDAIVAESFNSGDYASSSDSGYEDPDWAPVTSKNRTRPYPSLEERKARKKEQNKNAATRYRQKKKQEIEVILSEERELQEKNETLKAEVEEIAREMKYLKSLLRHMFRAKGMIP